MTMQLTAELETKRAQLNTRLKGLGRTLIAYSGGVDSAFLAWAAHRVLGEESLLTARFQFLPSPLNAWLLSPPFTPPSVDCTATSYALTSAKPPHSRASTTAAI